jgi:hypothetical protein
MKTSQIYKVYVLTTERFRANAAGMVPYADRQESP